MPILFLYASIKLFEADETPVPALANILEIAQQIRKSDEALSTKERIKKYLLEKWCHLKHGSFYHPTIQRDDFDMHEYVSKKQVNALFENFRVLGMIDPYEPSVDDDLLYIVFWPGRYARSHMMFEAAKNYYLKAKERVKGVQIIILASNRVLEKYKTPYKGADYGAPNNFKRSKDIAYWMAKDKSVPTFVVVTSTPERAHTPDYARTLKEWLFLEKNPRGGTIVVVARQPLSQDILTVFDRCFEKTQFKIKILAISPSFRFAQQQDPLSEAISRMLPNRPAKLSNKDIAKCMDTLPRTMVHLDMKF